MCSLNLNSNLHLVCHRIYKLKILNIAYMYYLYDAQRILQMSKMNEKKKYLSGIILNCTQLFLRFLILLGKLLKLFIAE